MAIEYEWDIEGADKHGDILDHDFSEKLKQLSSHAEHEVGHFDDNIVRAELVLVRTVGNEWEGVTGRSWAYVTSEGLPTEFDDGNKVPQRFLKEFDRNREWAIKV